MRAQSAPPLETIRIASGPTDAITPLLYAMHAGLFQRAGLNVTITKYSRRYGNCERRSQRRPGRRSVGSRHDNAGPRTRNTDLGRRADGRQSARVPNNGLFVSAASPIHTAKDLTGKTIAITGLRGIFEVALDAWLDQNGVAPTSVKLIEMSPTEMPVCRSAGQGRRRRRLQSDFVGCAVARCEADRIPGERAGTESNRWVLLHDGRVGKRTSKRIGPLPTRDPRCNHIHQQTRERGVPAPLAIHRRSVEVLQHTAPSPRVLYINPASIQPWIDVAAKFHINSNGFPARDMISPYALKAPTH